MRTRVVLAVASVCLSLVACGGDDDDVSGDERPYVDALVESAAASDDDEFDLDAEQAECLAPKWVRILGADRLEEAGVTPEELAEDDFDFSALGLSEDDGNDLYDAVGECDIDLRGAFMQGLNEDESLSDEDRACLEEAFDDDLLRRILITGFVEGEDAIEQNEELMSDVFAVFAECPGAAPD